MLPRWAAAKRQARFTPRLEVLEDRCVLTTINFMGELGSAANFTKSQTTLSMTTTAPVEVGNSVVLEFAVKPQSKATNPPPSLTAVAVTPTNRSFTFQVDANVLNPDPGGGSGGAVQTVIFSLHDVSADSPSAPTIALPTGTVFTVTFTASDAQSMTAAEFSGLAVATTLAGNGGKKALDRFATTVGPSSTTVSSGPTPTTRFARELLIGAIGVRGQVDAAAPNNSTNNLGFTAGAGYTVWTGNGTPSGNSGNKNSSIHPEYRMVSAIGTYVADGTLNSNAGGPWATAIATYVADPTSHFGITAGPDSDPATPGVQISAGSLFNLTVSALDDSNNVSPSFRGTVHFTVSDPVSGEMLPVDYTFTTADAGVHTFTNLTKLFKSGLRTITVGETPDDPTITSGQTQVFIVAPTFTINDASVEESGGGMTFTVSLDRPIDIPVTVDVNFTGVTATGGGVDFTSTTKQVTFAANDTSPKTLIVPVTNDTLVEGSETFTASLSTTTDLGGRIVDFTDTGTGTILDTTDTAIVTILATDAAAAEPSDNGQFTVSLSAASSTPTVVNYTVSGTAAAGSDYSALLGSVTIPANALSATIPVTVQDDALVEGDETVIVTLTSIGSGDPQISVGSPGSATVTIADTTDAATVSVSATDGAAEPNDPGQFTVSLSAASSTATVVSYTVSGTAVAGSDYSTLSGTVTIPAGALNAPIPVGVLDDSDVELSETVIVTLGSVTSGDPQISIGAPGSATVTIVDNDTTTVSIAATDAAAGETPTNPGQFTVSLASGKTAPAGGVLVSYSVAGTATATADYAALSGSVLIPAGAGSATIDVSGIVDDNVVEASETVAVTLTGTSHPGVLVGAPASATVTIADNDAAVFTISDAIVSESAGTMNLTISLSNPVDIAIAVNVAYSDTTTSAADFDHAADSATFAALSTTSQSVSVAITNDNIVEAVESFLASLSTSTALGGRSVTMSDTGIGTITDNDSAVFTIDDVSVNEGAGTATFTVGVSNPLDIAVTVNVSYSDGSTSAADFDHATDQVTFAALSTASQTVTVAITNDNIVEAAEMFFAALGTSTALGGRNVNLGDTGQGTITDNDTAAFTINDVSVNEGAGTMTFTVSLSNPIDIPVSVDVGYSDGTTSAGDFDHAADSAAFAALSTAAQPVSVAIANDNIVEAAETFLASLSTLTALGGRSVSLSDTGTGTITDNDTAVFTIGDASVSEAAGTMNLTIALSNPVDIAIALNVGYSDTTTSAGDFDHTADSATFAALSTASQNVSIAITNDNVVEAMESFLASLTASTGLAGRAIDLTDTAVGTITDNDAATFTINDVSVNESAGTATFTVGVSNPIDISVAINVGYSNVTTSAADFDHTADLATFAALTTASQTVTVAITNDNIVEAAETYLASLSTSTALGGRSVNLGDTGQGTITDNDTAAFTIDDVSVNEGAGTMTFTVSLSNPIDIPVSVDVGYSDGTTSAGDFDHAADAAVFAALSTAAQPVSVAITNDNIVEAAETFLASLSTLTALGGRSVSLSDTGIGTITDNDTAAVTINDVSVNEGAGTATFTVSLSNPIDIAIGVAVNYSDTTTSAGDFDHAADAASFAALSTAPQPVTVAIFDDNIVEATETFLASLNLTTAVGTRSVVFADTGVGTILNNDAATFNINDVSGNESAGTLTFTVTLSSAVDTQVSVVATTANDTATTADNDYTAATQTLTFAAGQTSQPFTVSITNDSKVELNETFFVNLSSPSVAGRAVTIGDGQGVGQINYDDVAVVSIVANDPEATELPVDSGQFTVTLSNPSQVSTVVAFTVSGTATEGSDYTSLVPHQVTFAPGATTAVINVTPLTDSEAETDETVIVTLSSVVSGVPGAISIAAPPNNSATVILHDPTVTKIDNHDPGWEHFGFIRNTGAGFMADYAYGGNNAQPEFARWTFNILPGTYRVSVTWPNIVLSPRATNAPFSIYDGTTAGPLLGTALVNQTGAPVANVVDGGLAYQDLVVGGNGGIYTITGNTMTVQLTDAGINGFILADAVRAERLAPELAENVDLRGGGDVPAITNDLLAPAVPLARSAWSGADASLAARLASTRVLVADLPPNVLGLASAPSNTIWVDVNAAGGGWRLPGESGGSESLASRFDLVTVIAHEMGHLLGLSDLVSPELADDLMAGALSPGAQKTLHGDAISPAQQPATAARDLFFGMLDRSSASQAGENSRSIDDLLTNSAGEDQDEPEETLTVSRKQESGARAPSDKSLRRVSDPKVDRRNIEAIDRLFSDVNQVASDR